MMRDLSMHIMDIVQNSVRADATLIEIIVDEDLQNNVFSFSVKDNGKGMTAEFLKTIKDPFSTSRTTRKVGLGIPLLLQTCMACGYEDLELTSEVYVGTYIKAKMEYNHIDRPPLGDIENSIFLLIVMNPSVMFKYTHKYNQNEYVLDMHEVRDILGDLPLDNKEVSEWLKENINEGLSEIRQSFS